MIFHNDTPDTTMDEDLAALGLPTLMEAAPAPSRTLTEAAHAAKASDDDDEDERTEVDVKDEGMTEGELRLKLYQLAADNNVAEEDFAAFIARLDEQNGTNFTSLFEGDDEDDDDDEDEDEDEEDEEDEDEKCEAAIAVLDAFYNHLAEMTEDEKPSYDDLVGVIEAFEYVMEARRIPVHFRKGKKVKGPEARAITAMSQARTKYGPGVKLKRKGRRVFRAGVVGGGESRLKGIAGRKSQRGRGRATRRVSLRKGAQLRSDTDITGESLAELNHHLIGLRETLSEAEYGEMVENASTELLEGFKAIYDGATSYYEAIAEELNEDDNGIDEDDARVQMGRHLESIANDAYRVAELVSEGEANLEDAADDLQALSADLDDALEAMKGIE